MIYNNQSQKKGTLLPLQKLQLATVLITHYSRIPKIRMMATFQIVIKSFWRTVFNFGYYSPTATVTVHEQYPHPAGFQIDRYSSIAPVTVHEQYFRKARGQVTIHKQYQSLFIYSARHNNQKLLFAFGEKGFHLNKSILLSVNSAIS